MHLLSDPHSNGAKGGSIGGLCGGVSRRPGAAEGGHFLKPKKLGMEVLSRREIQSECLIEVTIQPALEITLIGYQLKVI